MTRIGSKKSLVYKLGIKDGFKVYMHNPPAGFHTVLGRLPKNVVELEKPISDTDFILIFMQCQEGAGRRLPQDAQLPQSRGRHLGLLA